MSGVIGCSPLLYDIHVQYSTVGGGARAGKCFVLRRMVIIWTFPCRLVFSSPPIKRATSGGLFLMLDSLCMHNESLLHIALVLTQWKCSQSKALEGTPQEIHIHGYSDSGHS